MFRRRQPLPFLRWAHGLVWPRTGWRRFGVYHLKRLTRLAGTPHNIAAGFACGAAISFTPLIGFHILLGCLLALLVRGNLIAVVAGTLVGNPWTFPFIWVATYELGQFLIGGRMGAGAELAPLSFADLVNYAGEVGHLVITVGPIAAARRLASIVDVVIWPMLVGSIPLGLVAGLLTYFPLVRMVTAYQEARRRRRERGRGLRRATLEATRAATDADAGAA